MMNYEEILKVIEDCFQNVYKQKAKKSQFDNGEVKVTAYVAGTVIRIDIKETTNQ
jgi:hypothetical protein